MFNDRLYAIANYGTGVSPYQAQFLARCTGLPVVPKELTELRRLCRSEPKAKGYPLTAFLSRCHKQLKHQGIRYIVSFSDPYHGHSGGIYRAANFDHLGTTQAGSFVKDVEGNIRNWRFLYRYAKKEGISMAEAREVLGYKRVKMPPKDRWFLKL